MSIKISTDVDTTKPRTLRHDVRMTHYHGGDAAQGVHEVVVPSGTAMYLFVYPEDGPLDELTFTMTNPYNDAIEECWLTDDVYAPEAWGLRNDGNGVLVDNDSDVTRCAHCTPDGAHVA